MDAGRCDRKGVERGRRVARRRLTPSAEVQASEPLRAHDNRHTSRNEDRLNNRRFGGLRISYESIITVNNMIKSIK